MRLSDAFKLTVASTSPPARENVRIYHLARLDEHWTVLSVPSGGITVAALVKACDLYQKDTTHRNIAHVSAYYLKAARVGEPGEIEITVIKRGRSLTHLKAVLLQKDVPLVDATVIFCNFDAEGGPSLTPSSDHFPQNPLLRYPVPSHTTPLPTKFNFNRHVQWSEVRELEEARRAGLEWGAWVNFKTEERETIGIEHLAFLADLFRHGPDLLRGSEIELPPQWFPTLVITIQFFQRFDPETMSASFGLYSNCTSLKNGRHDNLVEVWTLPKTGEESACLMRSWQMALTMSAEVNRRAGKL